LQDPPSPCTEEEEGAFLKFGINQINLNPKKTSLHHLCERFGHVGPLVAEKIADTVAENHLELLLNHYLESPLSACEKMMRGVLFSSLCSLEHALFFFLHTVNDSSQKARQKEDYIVRKAKALKALGLLVTDLVDDTTFRMWMALVSNTLLYAVVLFGSRLHDEDRQKLKDHMSMEELIDIIKVLLARSMPEMSSVIQTMLDGAQCGMLCQRSGRNKAPTDL
ncbi:uncharacterized protein LOC121918070, partial [Sceloporus undulatus]|uniref:uncharacterized protein LOC121918070 n=1 Tax=Sceloporus undulatus TaxID=8520 RepID=UPI001C4D49F2